MMMVVLQYVAPLSIITFAYIRMGVKLWGTKTPGQVMAIIVTPDFLSCKDTLCPDLLVH